MNIKPTENEKIYKNILCKIKNYKKNLYKDNLYNI